MLRPVPLLASAQLQNTEKMSCPSTTPRGGCCRPGRLDFLELERRRLKQRVGDLSDLRSQSTQQAGENELSELGTSVFGPSSTATT